MAVEQVHSCSGSPARLQYALKLNLPRKSLWFEATSPKSAQREKSEFAKKISTGSHAQSLEETREQTSGNL